MNSFVSDRVLRSLRGAGAHLCPGRQDLPDLGDELLGRNTGFAGDPDLVELARLGEERLRRRQREAGERGAADRRRRRRT